MKASEWEYIKDEAYYGLYAVRTKENRSFTQAIHVNTVEEAIFLTNSLNELLRLQEREQDKLEAIREARK